MHSSESISPTWSVSTRRDCRSRKITSTSPPRLRSASASCSQMPMSRTSWRNGDHGSLLDGYTTSASPTWYNRSTKDFLGDQTDEMLSAHNPNPTLHRPSPPFLRPSPGPSIRPLTFSAPRKRRSSSSSSRRRHPSLSVTNSSAVTADPRIQGQFRVDVLSESLPFIQKFRGKTIVVKYGGAAMKSEHLRASVVNDLVLLSCVGLRPVLVHGGGPEINSMLARLGIRPEFIDGLRVTDAATMEVVSMVLVGSVNKNLVSLISQAGATAVGLSGLDGGLFTARPGPEAARLGFVGEVARVDPSVLRHLTDQGFIPVIASVSMDENGQKYNINADTVAGELAAALGAEKLILLTDVPGILGQRDDPGSLVKEIDIKGVKRMVNEGKIAGGMIPKVNCCVRSLAQGVRTASIIDGRVPHSLLLEIMTDEGTGTMITG